MTGKYFVVVVIVFRFALLFVIYICHELISIKFPFMRAKNLVIVI